MSARLTFTAIYLMLTQVLMAQQNVKKSYPVVVSFQSHCCGVPSDSSLRNFIDSFKQVFKIEKITAERIGPVGREGEYYLAFPLTELGKKQSRCFILKLKEVKQLPEDPGSFSFIEKMEIDPAKLPARATSRTLEF